MKRVSIDQIKGKEILAKDIFSDTGIILMVSGTEMKIEYVQKLKMLDVNYVYIEENKTKSSDYNIGSIEESKIKLQCQEQVKATIERYVSYEIQQLTPIIKIADTIISDVLSQKEVIYNVSGIREKSEQIFAHSINVCALSILIAIRMKLPKEKIKEIAIGALLHDFGLVYQETKEENEQSPWNDENTEEYKQHVIRGYCLLNNETWISQASKDIVLSHHERLDGSGYPFGISGKKIKKATRIVTVCDMFDHLIYGNAYKECKVYEAIEYIISQADVLFDMSVVKMFIDTVAAYPNGSVVWTNRGDKAVVVGQNRQCPTRPVIRTVDKNSGRVQEKDINLVEDLTLFIVDSDI